MYFLILLIGNKKFKRRSIMQLKFYTLQRS